MGSSKISVTIPEEMYKEIKGLASRKKMKLSHLVADALAAQARKMKEEAFIQQVNEVFGDPEVVEEQHLMAETIATHTNVEELPW
jgi:metal-responsive CopG/Arc/MetJ family transcriptional regulator